MRLTKDLEEEFPLLRTGFVGGPARVAATVALPDVADREHAAAALQLVEHVLLRWLQLVALPVCGIDKQQGHVEGSVNRSDIKISSSLRQPQVAKRHYSASII